MDDFCYVCVLHKWVAFLQCTVLCCWAQAADSEPHMGQRQKKKIKPKSLLLSSHHSHQAMNTKTAYMHVDGAQTVWRTSVWYDGNPHDIPLFCHYE